MKCEFCGSLFGKCHNTERLGENVGIGGVPLDPMQVVIGADAYPLSGNPGDPLGVPPEDDVFRRARELLGPHTPDRLYTDQELCHALGTEPLRGYRDPMYFIRQNGLDAGI